MEKVWLKSYEQNVPEEIDLRGFSSLVGIIDSSLAKFAQLPMYTCMGKTLTFNTFDTLSRDLAAYFQEELKLKKGDRVAIMLPNILQYPVALFAALRAGLVVVNVNPLYTPRELEHQLRDSGATTIIILENFAHVLQQVITHTPVKHVIVTSVGAMLGFPKGLIVDFVLRKIKKVVPKFTLPGHTTFAQALHAGKGRKFTSITLNHDDLAFLQYTGGTTGVSKGAMLSHGNMLANVTQAHTWIKSFIREGREIIITALPLYHIFSLTANCLVFMKVGGHNILIPNPRDMPGFCKTLQSIKFTVFTGVNTLFNGLLNNPSFARLDFSEFRFTLGGGMAVQKSVADRWRQVTGCTLTQAYGLTETAPAATINPLTQKEFTGSIGLPLSSTLISIRDDDDKELGFGTPGELCIKGPQVMKGYWKRDDETQKVFSATGWLKTGDVATMDEKGFVYIVDRKKDMILVSGFNVYPNEIEEVAALHPGVLEAAAIGIPDTKSGEAVKLFVVKKDPQLTEDAVLNHCRENLTGYKMPKVVEFRKDLPKTNVGKILRRSLRE